MLKPSTKLSRRTLLVGSAALGAGLATPAIVRAVGTAPAPAQTIASSDATAPPSNPTELRAGPTTAQLLPPPQAATNVWGYNGSSPGPVIRVKVGERVRRRLVNDLPQPTAVHWHGIRIANAMDGAAGMTQEPVAPGGAFDYDFVAPDAGTYWYHSHDRSWEQAARGLHGPLIVEEPEPWDGADREIVLHLDDWRLERDGSFDEASLGELMDWSHGGRMGTALTTNGEAKPDFAVRAGERIRLRLINAANARLMALDFDGMRPRVVALDGHPVAPRPAEDGRYVVLAPAQRADVVVDMVGEPGDRVPLRSWMDAVENEGWAEVATFTYGSKKALPARPSEVIALPDTMRHDLDLSGAHRVRLDMTGGAMGDMTTLVVEGRERTFEELVGLRKVWGFNGIGGDLDEPLFRTEVGRTVRLQIRNGTRWLHAMHLHGHHFQVLARNGQRDPNRDWRDTVLSEPMETLDVAFDATNPGRWLLHCHMLEHQAGGMITWFEVA